MLGGRVEVYRSEWWYERVGFFLRSQIYNSKGKRVHVEIRLASHLALDTCEFINVRISSHVTYGRLTILLLPSECGKLKVRISTPNILDHSQATFGDIEALLKALHGGGVILETQPRVRAEF